MSDTGMVKTAGDIVSLYSLHSCTECGTCDNVCPSGRNGGIHPDAVIAAVNNASESSDLAELQTDVWKCLMCHRCSTACPSEIDVAGAIRSLRYDSASSGKAPKRFKKASDTLAAEGRAFAVTDYVNQKRKELGLPEIMNDNVSAEELRMIMSRTGFCNE